MSTQSSVYENMVFVQVLFTKRMDFSGILLYPGLHLHPNEKLHIDEISEFLPFNKVRTFWEGHKIWKKSFSRFGRLLSKCTKHEEDCANFCVLLRKSELYAHSCSWIHLKGCAFHSSDHHAAFCWYNRVIISKVSCF